MKHESFAYTRGMDEQEITDLLAETRTGVLALADGNEAYAIPIAHAIVSDELILRLGITETSEKRRFLDTTRTACYVVYDTQETGSPTELESRSVLLTGTLERVTDTDYDAASINRRFPPIRVFSEDIESVEIEMYRFAVETRLGRITPDFPE